MKKIEHMLNELTGMVVGERVNVIHARITEAGDGRPYLDVVWCIPFSMVSRGIQLREGSVQTDLARLPVDARWQIRNLLASQKIDGSFRHELLSAGLIRPSISDIPS